MMTYPKVPKMGKLPALSACPLEGWSHRRGGSGACESLPPRRWLNCGSRHRTDRRKCIRWRFCDNERCVLGMGEPMQGRGAWGGRLDGRWFSEAEIQRRLEQMAMFYGN